MHSGGTGAGKISLEPYVNRMCSAKTTSEHVYEAVTDKDGEAVTSAYCLGRKVEPLVTYTRDKISSFWSWVKD